MIHINQWAAQHGVSNDALQSLCHLIGISDTGITVSTGISEASTLQQVRIKESKKGNRLWRNNNGACEDVNGRVIRYGLGNDSSIINKIFKSSDLIGITPYRVQQHDINKKLGIFTSIEMKRQGWKYTGTNREVAQLNWLKLVITLGGIGRFSTGE